MKINPFCLFLILIVFTVSFTLTLSCRHNADISGLPEVCFTGDVLPVFTNNCSMSGCHDGQGESDLTLTSYDGIMRGIVPGKPNSSRIYKAIIASAGENGMPPRRPLSLENRTIISVWIEQGASLTTCADTSGGGGGGGTQVIKRACFSRDILPVLVSKCGSAGCHDASAQNGGYNFTSYTSTMNAVTPGNPGQSRLYRVITAVGEDNMPPSSSPQLTVAEIDSIGKWISYGALNETCGETCDTINPVTFSGTIWPVIQTTCTGCHTGSAPSGNISLGSYNNVAAVASGGMLLNALKGNGVAKMPPSGSMSVCRIRQFEIWISNGYPNN